MLRQVVEEQGLSTDEIRTDPELQKQVREAIQQRSRDPEFRAQIRDALVQQKEHAEQVLAGYDLIARNNLFKPLGSGEEQRGPAYALQITSIAPEGKRAIILEHAGNKLHDVTEGDRIGETVVELIEDRHVRLKTPDGIEELRLDDMQFIGGSGGGPQGRRRGGGGAGSRGGLPAPSARPGGGGSERAQAVAERMRQRMQGRSPQEIKEMMQQMQKFRARRGGEDKTPGGQRGGDRAVSVQIKR